MNSTLRKQIESVANDAGAEAVAVSVYDYGSSTLWSYRGDRWFHAASTIKVAVLAALFAAVEEERLSLHDRIHVRNRFLSAASGKAYTIARGRDANNAVHEAVGKQMQIRTLAEHMIATSSNLATNLLTDLVGIEQARTALDGFGIDGIELRRGVEDEDAFEEGVNNRVTSNGLVALFRLIEEGRHLSSESSKAMLEILRKQEFRSGIPAGIPESLRDDVRFAHKTGDMSSVTHDAGLVYLPERPPYAVAILTEWHPDASGRRETVAALSQAVFHHVTQDQA